MPKNKKENMKLQALRRHSSLNPRPDRVRDELFQSSDFFDPHDLIQVKYEMLRCVQKEGRPVSQSAARFGFSRPSFYQAQAAFERAGLPGLLPGKRGPKRAHKLTAELIDFIEQRRQEDPSLRARALAELIEERLEIVIHPRTIERHLAGRQKKPRQKG